MYELVQAAENSYYIESPARVGLVRLNETDVCLIDAGSDKDAGRRIRQILDANNWHLTAIYNTHSNADHIGGNGYLQQRTGCRIFAPGIECDFTNHPILETAFLYGGYPPAELRHKFLLAQPSSAEPLTEKDLPASLSMIPLPGHFFDMTGFRSADGVVYLADCLSSRETLDKYHISFIYDVAAYLDTLRRVMQMQAKLFVPAHAEPSAGIASLAQENLDRVEETAARIEELCAGPKTFEKLLQAIFSGYGLQMDFSQYVLVGSTVRSFLSWMKDTGRLEARFENGELLWQAHPPKA